MPVFTKFFAVFAACGLLSAALDAPAWAAGKAAKPAQGEIALTFDDLPSHGVAPAGVTRTAIVQRIVDALKKAKAPPVYGFVNAAVLQYDPANPAVLKIWRDSGNLIGNHTFSHADPDKVSAAAFLEEVRRDEDSLRSYAGDTDWHWLRLPFLRAGDTAEKREALRTYLQVHDYRLADVSVAFNDYDYNPPYARCLAKNDAAGIAWLRTHYLAAAAEALDQAPGAARRAFGRDIKQVLLLHIGAFDAEMFPALLDLIQSKHFKLIALPDAARDPVYVKYAYVRETWGGSLPQRAMVANNIPVPPAPYDYGAELKALCQ